MLVSALAGLCVTLSGLYAVNYGRHFAVVYDELNPGHTLPAPAAGWS